MFFQLFFPSAPVPHSLNKITARHEMKPLSLSVNCPSQDSYRMLSAFYHLRSDGYTHVFVYEITLHTE